MSWLIADDDCVAWRLVRATLLILIVTTLGRFEGFAQPAASLFHTTVTPKPAEDVAHPCEYELRILSGDKRIRALFVVFERGPELQHFYEQPKVVAFAREHDLVMLMPLSCPAKNDGDIDVDPDRGLGRALLTAVDQFSVQTKHPELMTAPLLLHGFSGAGALVGRLVSFAPNRIATAILSHAGQVPPLNLDTINLSGAALKVPELILVGGKDKVVGTELAYSYFLKYWQLGAPWLYATQNDAGHFCNEDATDLILAWMNNILDKIDLNNGSAGVNRNSGSYASFRKKLTGSFDSGNRPLAEAVDLKVKQSIEGSPTDELPAGWLPSNEVALRWKSFADLPDHHATAKH